MQEIRCAECGKVAPDAEHWPERWIGVDADGSVVYPAGQGAFVAVENMPPSSGKVVVCSDQCLRALREARRG